MLSAQVQRFQRHSLKFEGRVVWVPLKSAYSILIWPKVRFLPASCKATALAFLKPFARSFGPLLVTHDQLTSSEYRYKCCSIFVGFGLLCVPFRQDGFLSCGLNAPIHFSFQGLISPISATNS